MTRNKVIHLLSIGGLIISTCVALTLGSISLTLEDMFSLLSHQWSDNMQAVIDLRLPRIILSLLAGASLAVSGLLLQIVLRNPLADPSIIGINAGAIVIKLIILFLVPQLFLMSTLLSFIGGICVFLFIYKIIDDGYFHPLKLLISGVAVNALLNGIIDIFKLNPLNNVPTNLSQKNWDDVLMVVGIVIILLISLFFVGKLADMLQLNDEVIIALGLPIKKMRIILSCCAIILASLMTAVVGNIAFIGLLIPAIAKRLVGTSFKDVYPLSIVLGALLLLLADTIGRTIVSPIEISASIILAFIGAPFLIILVKKEFKF